MIDEKGRTICDSCGRLHDFGIVKLDVTAEGNKQFAVHICTICWSRDGVLRGIIQAKQRT